MYWYIYLFIIFLLIIYGQYREAQGISLNEREPIFGVYRQPNSASFLKFWFMYVILKIRKLWNFAKLGEEENESEAGSEEVRTGGYGTKSRPSTLQMDCTQTLSAHPKAIDAVYFNGANRDGCHVIAATARRPHGVINGFLIIKMPNVGLLVTPKYPDTLMFQSTPTPEFSAEGLELKVIQPMACWTVKYDGFLRVERSESDKYPQGKLIKATINGIWNSSLPYFDFDTDMSPFTVATAMAHEPWSQEYFHLLKEMHQTHYEQFGELNGSLQIEGDHYDFKMDAVRDHSYGEKRDWKNFHRYSLHYIILESGVKLNIGIVSMPIVFSSLQLGYLYTAEGSILPIDKHSFRLYEHGEAGVPPTDYAFSLTAGGDVYHVKVQVVEGTKFNIGWEWEAEIMENLCHFEVNGVKGWGCAEFQYRYLKGRPQSSSKMDPDWTHSLNKG